MGALRKLKIVLLLALIGLGKAGSLTACVFEDGWRGGHEEGRWR